MASVPDSAALTADATLLAFTAAGQRHRLPVSNVREILRGCVWTRVPQAPPSLLGVANLRGAVLPVVSLARLLGLAQAPPAAGDRVLVIDRSAKGRLGLLVDEVAGLRDDAHGTALDLDALLARDFAAAPRGTRAVSRGGADAAPQAGAGADPGVALIALRLAGQDFALALADVAEVLAAPPSVAAMPDSDAAMLGVIARRGGVLPLVCLRALLALPRRGAAERAPRVAVVRIGEMAAGLVADDIGEILRVPREAIDGVPPILTRGRSEARIAALCRVDGGRRLVGVLDPSRLFDDATMARLRAASEGAATAMPDPGRADEAAQQFVVFRLGDEPFGLPIGCVEEVVRRPAELTRVPRAPAFVAGVMNLRGRVVPVIDQRGRFAVAGSGPAGRVLVVRMDGMLAGFAVDAVSEVLSVPASALRPTPELAAGDAGLFDRIALRDGGDIVLLVDPKALLDRAERDLLAAFAEA